MILLFTSYSYFQALSHLPIKCSKLVCSVILTHTDTDLVRSSFLFLHHIISLKTFFSWWYQLLTIFILPFLLKLFLIFEWSLFVGKRKSVFRKVFRCIFFNFSFYYLFCRNQLPEYSSQLPICYYRTKLSGTWKKSLRNI